MSADRTVAVGEYGCGKVRCNGNRAGGGQCTATMTGQFRRGIKSARARAKAAGWQVAVRRQWAPNASVIEDFCPDHQRRSSPGTSS